jgi:hypothetical protein
MTGSADVASPSDMPNEALEQKIAEYTFVEDEEDEEREGKS